MRRSLKLAVLTLLCLAIVGLSSSASLQSLSAEEKATGRSVMRITEGTTLRVFNDGSMETIGGSGVEYIPLNGGAAASESTVGNSEAVETIPVTRVKTAGVAPAEGIQPPEEDATLVLSEEDEQSGVSYLIGVDNRSNEVIGRIEYESTVTGIEQFRAFNNRELDKILQELSAPADIPVKISFNSPLDQVAFAEFVEQYEIAVENYLIYMREPDGRIATIQGEPPGEELVPGEYFDAATNSIAQEYAPGAEFLGWVEVNGVVTSNAISKISSDERVFLVDVMRVFLDSKLTDQALAEAGIAKSTRWELVSSGFTEIYQKPLAWDLYHLGLMQEEGSQLP